MNRLSTNKVVTDKTIESKNGYTYCFFVYRLMRITNGNIHSGF